MFVTYFEPLTLRKFRRLVIEKLLKNKGPRIDRCGTPESIFNNELNVESILTLCSIGEIGWPCKSLRLFMSTP